MEVLLQWKKLSLFEATWERFEAIRDQFPDFNLEDKVRVLGGSSVTRDVRYTYARRGRA